MHDSANNFTKVHLDLPNHWWRKGESVWAKPLGEDLYEIQNIPFCAYGLNLKDIVLATPDPPELKPEVRAVITPSGNRTLRLNFCDKLTKEQQQPVMDALASIGTALERATLQFVCVSVPPALSYESVCEYLAEQEKASLLEYETCEARVPGSFDDLPRSTPAHEV